MACKRCGKCCSNVGVVMPRNVDMARFYSFHGYKMRSRLDGYMELVLDQPCRYYRADVGCTIHGTAEVPQFCRDFLCTNAQGGDIEHHT